MGKKHVFEIINRNPVMFLATIDGSEPRVRGMMLYKADESGIVFHTGPQKDVYRQIIENPNVSTKKNKLWDYLNILSIKAFSPKVFSET